MAEEWTTPAMAGAMASPVQAPTFELRPLSLGEVLDRTFAVYRSRFWLFAGLAAIYGAMNTIAAALSPKASVVRRRVGGTVAIQSSP